MSYFNAYRNKNGGKMELNFSKVLQRQHISGPCHRFFSTTYIHVEYSR